MSPAPGTAPVQSGWIARVQRACSVAHSPAMPLSTARRARTSSPRLWSCVAVASMAGLETLDLAAFAAGFRDRVWRDVPERLNPFHPESVLRKLDRPGEVFHLHTTQDPVGSPMARSLGLVPPRGGAHARK